MAVYTSTETFATESGVFAYAAYTFTGNSEPSDVEVYEFARDVCSSIVTRTEKEGSRQAPPYSGSDTVGLGRLLKKANEIGAAYMARMAMASLNGDERSLRVAENLRMQWAAIMGKGSVEGTGITGGELGSGGELATAISNSGGAFLLQADVTMGDVSLASNDSIEVDYPFTASTVD